MKRSKHESKFLRRSRPAMGTYLTIETGGSIGTSFDRAFTEAERIESIFSLYKLDSLVSRFNRAGYGEDIPGDAEDIQEFTALVSLALEVHSASDGAFSPFVDGQRPKGEFFTSTAESRPGLRKLCDVELDLNGIAKGRAVDCIASIIEHDDPLAAYTVNAGGDLRIGGGACSRAHLRLGTTARPVKREITMTRSSLATSSSDSPHPSTHYRGERVAHSSAVLASSCTVADAMTKVGLFANPVAVEGCARRFDAVILTFDAAGDLLGCFGAV